MGKGIIKSGGADGFYSVELTFERENIKETISYIAFSIELLTSEIDTMNEGSEKELVKLERNSYIKKKEYLQNNMPEDPTVSAWCADLTEGITGDVGTIEVPGERGIVQIQPGYESNSTYNATRDGQLQPSIASTPAATFYNLAMLPGWQKWKPTYRYGVISNIDTNANTCDVKLDSAESSQQNLVINQELNLTGINVSYMSCDSSAFEDGDEVLVKFIGQIWTGAQVIGFKDNPKSCGFQFKLTRGDGTLITESSGLLSYFKVYNSIGSNLLITSPIYNPETEYWSLELINDDDADPNGYWVEYVCDDGVLTQYPYIYKTDDKEDQEDLISLGSYDDVIPYWEVTYTGIPGYVGCSGDVLTTNFVDGVAKSGSYAFLDNAVYTKKINVKSSIPYKTTWTTRDSSTRTKRAYETWHVSSMTYQFGTCWNGEEWVPLAHKCCMFHDTPYSYCNIENTSAGPFTLTANTINLTITDSAIPIQEDVVEFPGVIEGVDHVATISGGADEPEIPVCDEGPKSLSCEPCENAGNEPFDYTHWYPGVYDCVTIYANYNY